MKRFYDFSLSSDALMDVRFLANRNGLTSNGDIESGILQGVVSLKRHPPAKKVGDVLNSVMKDNSIRAVVLIRNPDVVLDKNLPDRVARALDQLPADERWSVVGSGGLGPSEKRHLAIYASNAPAIPDCSGPQPVLDVMPDFYIINASFARPVIANCQVIPETALEPILVSEGYLQNRCAIFSPSLTVGIDGSLMARDIGSLRSEICDHFGSTLADQPVETLSGSIKVPPCSKTDDYRHEGPIQSENTDLSEQVEKTIRDHSEQFTLSIVVRTRFDRNHLLRRLLASLSRNNRGALDVEIVLSTDREPSVSKECLAQLQQDFCNLQIRLQQNLPDAHSRVTNMIGGLRAARHDYVMLIDDDDYVDLFALSALLGVNFMGNRPLIVTDSEVHDESWEETPSGRWILTQSTWRKTYPARGWQDIFSGSNQLPICAMIVPKHRLWARLDAFCFDHDLSEDYALFLLIFTDPQLPAIFELGQTFCHISLRGTENSVAMEDRRPWVSDIAAYLSDLTSNPDVAGPGMWALLNTAGTRPADIAYAQYTADLQSALERAESNAALLRQENAQLRNQSNFASEVA